MRKGGVLRLAALSFLVFVVSCGRLIPEGRPVSGTPPPVANALSAGVRPGPSFGALGLSPARAGAALGSFRESCRRLVSRGDTSGLTSPADWKPACDSAAAWPGASAHRFFETWFETAVVGEGEAFVTGYYEPEIAGVRTRRPGFEYPVYAMPTDLVRARAGEARPLPDGGQPLGRYDASGRFVPYHDRAAIEDGALAGKGLEIAWVADPVEFFFLQVQGSGRLRAPDGSVIRLGFAGQNGHDYTGIGSLMRDRGLLGSGPGQYSGSMQGIMRYLRDNPAEGRALMRRNRSWVFFRELGGDAPVGALGVPVRPRTTVAADPRFVPLGAPVWLSLDRAEANGLWIAQDTGGAIKGANRFDSFWGTGEDARRIAGGMSGRGRAVLLLPKGTLDRINSR